MRNLLPLGMLLVLTTSSPALAGKCDSYVRKASKLSGDAVVDVYEQMLQCDKDEAQQAFDEFMRSAKGVGAIVDLSLLAIQAKVYNPVWNMMEKIPDYEARDEIAKGVGAHCTDHDQVIPFLQGAYFGLRDIQFGQWERAFGTCESEDLTQWTETIVAKPPDTVYDEKYATITTAFAQRRKAKALPVLERAAITAANGGGPFNAIIEKMDLAMQPDGLGATMSDEDRETLEASLVNVANAVGPEQAALVADRLFNAGAATAAASLLPRVYPDRVQDGGRMLYGAASIEACDKRAVIHLTEVYEPSKRWSILADLDGPLRSFKPRLKCDSGTWSVVATPEPVASSKDIKAFGDELVAEWEGKGHDVKVRSEKTLELP